MPTSAFAQNIFFPVVQNVTRGAPRQIVKSASHYSSTLSFSGDHIEPTAAPEPSLSGPRNFLRERKFRDLRESLVRDVSPSLVWSHYTSLLNTVAYEKLPLEVHQQVLRRCTPPSVELRATSSRSLKGAASPHVHEGRFQTIIRNIRALDAKPALDDYHFILEQFAAVGHHVGVIYVYNELTQLGLTPRTKTYSLCLQAIAHRLTLPIEKVNHPKMVSQTRKMIADLMADMQHFDIPFTSVNLDLTIRILKETVDTEGFEQLMKLGYGIDLANPDRPPLEYTATEGTDSGFRIRESPIVGLPSPQPFSTSALNTTIDTLGRFGNVSRLVQAFEVLTVPLPQANQHLFSSFDDEDDFGVADGPSSATFTPPHARPNVTTYNMLLRHLCQAGHAILARHYLNQAMWLDRETEKKLKLSIRGNRVMYAPHFAINRGTLMPAFGESNRDKNVGLMRWLSTKIPRIIRNKKKDLLFWQRFQGAALQKIQQQQLKMVGTSCDTQTSPPSSPKPSLETDLPIDSVDVAPLQAPTPTLSGMPDTITKRKPWNLTGIFDFDIDTPPPTSIPSPAPPKHFDIDLHINILQRDIAEIETFAVQVENILGRTTQRLKERLGRRVWAGKDVYLQTDEKRQKLSRERWRDIVQFQPRNNISQFGRSFPPKQEALSLDKRAFSTTSQSAEASSRSSDIPASVLPHIGTTFRRH
ncbi:hypothetical protein BDZ94DRAFT_1244972 [Collybia nuda]|uniref:Uncharacterized protein n=1 Tax=Collybia nuda TaxID=64659 RepID=A0A9P6CJL6_9AGAR|nr:hypothetical protein BDZ94DRAFT_1244972 [Collybia nuda]